MSILMPLKAEVVLGMQLVLRHRAPRLAASLAALLALVSARDPATGTAEGQLQTLLIAAGVLGAVGGSRLLSPGGAFAMARHAAPPWWMAPAGRLLGVMALVTAALVLVAAALSAGTQVPVAPGALAVSVALAASTTACTMSLSPVTGASAAGGLGLLAALAGLVRPSGVALLLDGVPVLRTLALLAWNTLPLPWRAARWYAEATILDGACLLTWLGLGVGAAAWVITGSGTRAAS